MTTSTVQLPLAPAKDSALPEEIPLGRRRRIDSQAGRALEMLGHAIEYLTDEYLHAGLLVSADDPVLCAVRILMARNREIYFDCPVVPTFSERLGALLGRQKA